MKFPLAIPAPSKRINAVGKSYTFFRLSFVAAVCRGHAAGEAMRVLFSRKEGTSLQFRIVPCSLFEMIRLSKRYNALNGVWKTPS